MIRHIPELWVGHGSQQIAHQVVQLHVDDQMRGLLAAHRPAQHARKAEQGMASACQAIGLAVVADQLALHAEYGRLQRDEIDFLKCSTARGLA